MLPIGNGCGGRPGAAGAGPGPGALQSRASLPVGADRM